MKYYPRCHHLIGGALVVCHVSGSSYYITTTGPLLMVHRVALLLLVHYYPCPLAYASGGAPLQLERKGKF